MAEMEQLREQLQALRAAHDTLAARQQNVLAAVPGESPAATERLVYLPRERRCPKFQGKTMAGGLSIDDWVEEARTSIRARHMSKVDQAIFLYDHLEGEARNEIKYRSKEEREDPETVFKILIELYGCSQSYVGLYKQFFERRQKEGESLNEYSHALMSLLEMVLRSNSNSIPNSEIVLRDQFAENVRDSMLRRELKGIVRRDPRITLIALRQEAIRWVQEGERGSISAVRAPPARLSSIQSEVQGSCEAVAVLKTQDSELEEIRGILSSQQLQIDRLLQLLEQPRAISKGPGASPSLSRYRYDSEGRPICNRCNLAGHIARRCVREQSQHGQVSGSDGGRLEPSSRTLPSEN